ncbi:MAG: calcium/sodium antiporter [Methylacidiphilales bacterium]|nr:calcium/sodium antiporter [Candidatus Methylacidiphilales bacterium]MDW8349584.1 calcium/sodium antiporter [Verrucomicrobiae bacterium]
MSDVVISTFYIFLGLFFLYLGGEGLIRGSSALAFRLGLSSLVIGLTVVAFGTSAPELFVSVQAALEGNENIAAGNVVGSNIFNIAFILSITALIHPLRIQLQLLRFDVPILVGVTILFLGLFGDRGISRWEAMILFLGIVIYTVVVIRMAKREEDKKEIVKEFEEGLEKPVGTIWLDIGYVIGGLALLVGGSHFLINGASSVARYFGVSEAVIGLTIVAAGTSLPEMATNVVAALKKEPDIALGNIVGSNIFNILAIMGIAGLVVPFRASEITIFDLTTMLVFAIALLAIVLSGKEINRWKGSLLLCGYAVYLYYIWPK